MPDTPVIWLDEFRADDPEDGVRIDPQLTQLTNGNVLLAWTSSATSGVASAPGSDTVGQIFNAVGEEVGGEFLINNGSANDEDGARLAALPGGGFLSAFVDDSGPDENITLVHRDSSGGFVANGFVTTDLSGGIPDNTDPVIAVSNATSALIAWVEEDGDNVEEVRFKFYNPSTQALQIASTLLFESDIFPGPIDLSDITVLNNGNYVVAARRVPGEIWFEIVTANGIQFGFQRIAATQNNGDDEFSPNIEALSGGGFVVAWHNRDSFDNDIEFQMFDALGNTTSNVVTVGGTTVADNHTSPSVSVLDDGGFIVFYDDQESLTQASVQGQRYDSTGATVGNSFSVDAGNIGSISTETLGDGRVAITYIKSGTVRLAIVDTRDSVNPSPVYAPDTHQVGTIENDAFTVNSDIAYGWDGDDILTDGAGFAEIFAGNGNDEVRVNGVDPLEAFHGGEGDDTVVGIAIQNGTIYDLQAGELRFNSQVQILTGFENVTGSNADEMLIGNNEDNRLDGGAGADVMFGGGGNDTYIVDNLGDVVGELADEGTDTVVSSVSYIMGANIEGALLTGVGLVDVLGNSLDNTIIGNGARNGLSGGDGADTIFGMGGNDSIDGQNGADMMIGGTGSDGYNVDQAGDSIVEDFNGGEFDLVRTSITLTLPDNVEIGILKGGAANPINITGNDGTTDDIRNLMLGNDSVNTIVTFDGRDVILGRDGDDTINAGGGRDNIAGGGGADIITGGDGDDNFNYVDIGDAGDLITDFDISEVDVLDLRALFDTFAGGAALDANTAQAQGFLRLEDNGNSISVFVDSDGNAGGNAEVLLALLNNVTDDVTAVDNFILV